MKRPRETYYINILLSLTEHDNKKWSSWLTKVERAGCSVKKEVIVLGHSFLLASARNTFLVSFVRKGWIFKLFEHVFLFKRCSKLKVSKNTLPFCRSSSLKGCMSEKGIRTKNFRSDFVHKIYVLFFTTKNLDWFFSFSKRKPYHKNVIFRKFRENDSIWSKSSV